MLSFAQPAFPFTLPNQDNQPITLSDFLGQWIVVYFYPKDDTPGCTQEACGFRDRMTELTNNNVVVLGISKDSVASHKKFAEKYHLPFNLLSDPPTEVIQHYGAWQEKSMYGRKYMGIQRMTYLINPEGKVTKVWPKVTPKGHEKEILQAIGTLSD